VPIFLIYHWFYLPYIKDSNMTYSIIEVLY